MTQPHDRRAPGTTRIQFDAMVEVGGALGPSFEARAVNLSEEGMSLRTAYLPEVGQPVMCRFEAGPDGAVVAAGEVLWNEDMGNGGEFGIRFTNLDGSSTLSLRRILGVVHEEHPAMGPGRKVRLHIQGLASPMRARVKDKLDTGVTAYSELGFLEMGKTLHLEDAETGSRRAAFIDRVQVETTQGSNIPQLVVSLRYDEVRMSPSLGGVAVDAPQVEQREEQEEEENEAPAHAAEAQESAPADDADIPVDTDRDIALAKEPATSEDESDASIEEESNKLKSGFARNAAKVTPALMDWARRAKTTAALLAARASRGKGDDVEIPVRRTTAPAPGGGLHTSGRKVVRGSVTNERDQAEPVKDKGGLSITKKRAAVAGTIGLAAILAVVALRKPAPAPAAEAAAPAETTLAAIPTAPVSALPVAPAPLPPPADPFPAPAAMANYGGKPGKPQPFTNGSVGAHPNVIKIKMDGPVEAILGATQPTGFTIVTPNRKAIESANALVAKDSRLEGVRISNETGSAEFTVSFKDGVPNYIVRAHGETLEMVLADPNGSSKAEANAKTTTKKKKSRRHSDR